MRRSASSRFRSASLSHELRGLRRESTIDGRCLARASPQTVPVRPRRDRGRRVGKRSSSRDLASGRSRAGPSYDRAVRDRSTRMLDATLGRTRRRRRVAAGVVGIAVLIGADSLLVEPYWLEVSRHEATAPVGAPLVVAHLSDIHTHGFGARERRVVEILDRERPDVIVVTGDIVDEGDLEPARALFANLRAPLGVWAVRGNWENWRPPPNDRARLESFGARLLLNEGTLLRSDVWLFGLDDPMSGSARIDEALQDAPADSAKIALFHSPEIFDAVAPRIDLAFAGHTHGGQVRLPLVGSVWTPPGSGRYVDGWYTRAASAASAASAAGATPAARMFVSRGIGTSVLPVRLLCRPEVAIITIQPAR